jgi:hypothetical protein
MAKYEYRVVDNIHDLEQNGQEGFRVVSWLPRRGRGTLFDNVSLVMEREVITWPKIENDDFIPVENITPLLKKEADRCNASKAAGWGQTAQYCIFAKDHNGPHSWVAVT